MQNLEATALDDRTVEIVTSVPDPKLPTMDVYIVPKHIYESISADDLTTYDALDGVASGQYSLDEWRPGRTGRWSRTPTGTAGTTASTASCSASSPTPTRWSPRCSGARSTPPTTSRSTPSSNSRPTRTSRSSPAQQGGFTELALNGMAGGIGDGHPALQDINVRHAIFHAIDREGLFERVDLGLGAVGTTISPSADPSWIPDLGDENFTYDPDLANEMLDEAGYLDTDGDGVREMPDGSRPLEFRYAERSESADSARRSASS